MYRKTTKKRLVLKLDDELMYSLGRLRKRAIIMQKNMEHGKKKKVTGISYILLKNIFFAILLSQ